MASLNRLGDNCYQVRYRDENGKQRAKCFKKYREARGFQIQVEGGDIPKSNKLTVKDYLNAWLSSYGSPPLVRPNTCADYKNCIEKHIIPALGSIALVNLSKAQVQAFYNDLATKPRLVGKKNPKEFPPLSAKSIKNIHCTLSQALEQAVEDGEIKLNPAHRTKRQKVTTRAPEPPAVDKMNELLRRMEQHPLCAAMWTCALLGVRRGEALGATWTALDLKSHTMLISHQLTVNNLTRQLEFTEILKTDASYRRVPVPGLLEKKLLAEKKKQKTNMVRAGEEYTKSDFIFVDNLGLPVTPDSASRAFKKCATDVGIQSMHLHNLRGAYASYLLDRGESPKTVQDLLGHTTADFTLRAYAASLEKSRQSVADSVNTMYGDL